MKSQSAVDRVARINTVIDAAAMVKECGDRAASSGQVKRRKMKARSAGRRVASINTSLSDHAAGMIEECGETDISGYYETRREVRQGLSRTRGRCQQRSMSVRWKTNERQSTMDLHNSQVNE